MQMHLQEIAGYESIGRIAELFLKVYQISKKRMKIILKKIKPRNILFGCTGTIGEKFPEEKILEKNS